MAILKLLSSPSSFQTILSALELHQFSFRSWTITTGRELHPAPEDESFVAIIAHSH